MLASLGATRDGSKAWSKDMVAYWETSGIRLCANFTSSEDIRTNWRANCMQAKNATLTRCCVTPEQTVFGCPLRWFAPSTIEEESCVLLWEVMGQAVVANSDGGKNCVAGARSLKKNFWQRHSEDHQRERTCCSLGRKFAVTCRIRREDDRGPTRRGGADLQ